VFEWFVYLVYTIWIVSIATEVLSYLIGRYENKKDTKDTFTHISLILCNRARVQESGWAWLLLLTVWVLGMGAAASIAIHTVVSHAYVKRNHVVLWLLAALMGCSVAGTLADALSIGGPTGIRSQSRAASWHSVGDVVGVGVGVVVLARVDPVGLIFLVHASYSVVDKCQMRGDELYFDVRAQPLVLE